jgi:hypothetical protein
MSLLSYECADEGTYTQDIYYSSARSYPSEQENRSKICKCKRALMDLLPNYQNLDLNKSRQTFHHSLKEHHKISNIPNSEVSLRNVVKCG